MDSMTGNKPVDSLYMLLLSATFMMIAWIMESIWRNDKRGVFIILLFPLAIFFYIFKYWEDTRARCLFTVLLLIMVLFIGAFAGSNFIGNIFTLMQELSIWPYLLFMKIKSLVMH